MSSNETFLSQLDPSIRQVLKDSNIERCDILVGQDDSGKFASYQTSYTGEVQTFSTHEATSINDGSDNGMVYPIASLSKPIIAAGVSIMIDKLSMEEHAKNPYRELRGVWSMEFATIFNSYGELRGFPKISLKGDPAVKHMLCHYKGLASMNHIIWAPDSAALLSTHSFLDIISEYSANTYERKPHINYSNANYVLMALLIEMVSGQSLDGFLKQYIFIPLGMRRTYLTKEDLTKHPLEARARPFAVSGDGIRYPVPFDDMSFLSCIIEKSILGFFSCAADLGLFFRALLMAKSKEPVHKYFDMDLLRSMQRHVAGMDPTGKYGYTLSGLYTSLSTRYPGSHSLNRLLLPNSKWSEYTMDRKSENNEKKVEVYYVAGCSTGCASTIYLVPEFNLYVIILTNTIGVSDSSDTISRLILDELLRLKPSRLGRQIITWKPSKWQVIERGERHRTFYVDMNKEISIQVAEVFKNSDTADLISEATNIPCPNICGETSNAVEYENASTHQCLTVTGQGIARRVVMSGGLGPERRFSGSMRFVWTGKKFRICSAVRGEHPIGLSIDRFGDWRELEFTPDNDTYVNTLTREGLYMPDHFVRKA